MTAQLVNGLYTIKASDLQASAMLANADNKAIDLLFDWHQQLGHLNVRSVMDLSRDGRIDGLSLVTARDVNEFRCGACMKGKGKRLPAPANNIRETQPLATVHIDLWGPATVTSIGGAKHFLTCYDDYTRKVHLTFLKQNRKPCKVFSSTSPLLNGKRLTKSKLSDQIMGASSHQNLGQNTSRITVLKNTSRHQTLMHRMDELNGFI
jgi:hypothetical protein